MKQKINLRWKILAIYAFVLGGGVLIAANVIQDRYQTIFIEQKMTELVAQQEQIIDDLTLYVQQGQFQGRNDVETLIVSADKQVVAASYVPEQRLLNELLQIANSQQQTNLQYHYEIGEQLMNVQITKVSEAEIAYVISYVLTGVPSFLSNVLIQEVVSLFGVLFIVGSGIFLIWTLYIARDLQRINQFAQKLGQRDWEAKLRVQRNDEIGELAQKLQAVQQQLAASEAKQQAWFHQTSHDLKTPIAVIVGYSEAISDGIYPQGDLASSVEVIQAEAQHLNHKVEQLLRYAKMQQLESKMTTSDVVGIWQHLQRKLQPLHPTIELVIETQADGINWPGSEWQWEQVASNLLENAFRYAQTTITIQISATEILVANDGPTIPLAARQQIFTRFMSGNDGKYGLGLAICAEFAKQYGLDLDVVDSVHGIAFRFLRQS